MKYIGDNLKAQEVMEMAETIEDAIRLIREKIKELEAAEQVLLRLDSEQGGNQVAIPKRRKITNRDAIIEVLSEAGKPIPARRIVSSLEGKGKYTTLTVVRAILSRGKAKGLFINNKRGWTVTEKGKKKGSSLAS